MQAYELIEECKRLAAMADAIVAPANETSEMDGYFLLSDDDYLSISDVYTTTCKSMRADLSTEYAGMRIGGLRMSLLGYQFWRKEAEVVEDEYSFRYIEDAQIGCDWIGREVEVRGDGKWVSGFLSEIGNDGNGVFSDRFYRVQGSNFKYRHCRVRDGKR